MGKKEESKLRVSYTYYTYSCTPCHRKDASSSVVSPSASRSQACYPLQPTQAYSKSTPRVLAHQNLAFSCGALGFAREGVVPRHHASDNSGIKPIYRQRLYIKPLPRLGVPEPLLRQPSGFAEKWPKISELTTGRRALHQCRRAGESPCWIVTDALTLHSMPRVVYKFRTTMHTKTLDP
jgi:hypothetical protein